MHYSSVERHRRILSIVAETPCRPIPFPKSLPREIVIRDEHRTTKRPRETTGTEPDWGRCHRRFAFKAGGPALSPGTSVWPARIRSPAGRPDARRALALFITNSRIPNSKWTSVQVSFLHPPPPTIAAASLSFVLLLVFFQLRSPFRIFAAFSQSRKNTSRPRPFATSNRYESYQDHIYRGTSRTC